MVSLAGHPPAPWVHRPVSATAGYMLHALRRVPDDEALGSKLQKAWAGEAQK